MSVEAFLTAALETAVGHERVYRNRLPAGVVLPATSYQRIDTVRALAHDGPDGLPTARFQVDCWAENPDVADVAAAAVVAWADGYSDATYQRIEVADERDLDEPDIDRYRRSIDLLVTYAG